MRDMMAGGGDTGEASSADADEAEAGGCYGKRPEKRGRFAGQRENTDNESMGVRGDKGDARPPEWPTISWE